MKLARFLVDGVYEIGVILDEHRLVSLTRSIPGLGDDMPSLIGDWDARQEQVQRIVEAPDNVFAMADIALAAPVPRPGKVFAIGLNYADHIEETGMETPAVQTWFSKAVTSVTGPYDPVLIPRGSQAVDYEAEMVAVIGKGGKHISREDAADHIIGYCVGNDVSERHWQLSSPQWTLGKSFDTHAPHGPWITTSDEVVDPHALAISCYVNGELRQQSNTRQLVFDVFEQVAHLSAAMTLEPGDLIFTGTPAGVGMALDPPRFLKAGDRVRVDIERLGAIESPFVSES
jgi:ureidoglycolate lyase